MKYIVNLNTEYVYCDGKRYEFFDYPWVSAEDIETHDMDDLEINDELFGVYIDFLEKRFSVIQFKEDHAKWYWDEIENANNEDEQKLRDEFVKVLNEKFKNIIIF